MRFALMSEPQQGLSYDEILALVRTAEDAGFEAYFRSDHYASFPGAAGLPTTDAWATLAGLAGKPRASSWARSFRRSHSACRATSPRW